MKKNRFKTVFDEGKSCYSRYMVGYFRKADRDDLGIIASKKVGNSVVRHRVTRRIREVWRTRPELRPDGYEMIIIAKRIIAEKNYHEIEEDYERLIRAFHKYIGYEKNIDTAD